MACVRVFALVVFLALVAAPRDSQTRSLHTEEAHLPIHDVTLAEKQEPPSPALLLGFSQQSSVPQLHTPSQYLHHELESFNKVAPLPVAITYMSEPESRTSDVYVPMREPGFSPVPSSIPSLLKQNGLPVGLLPSSVASYSITNDGDFIVCLQEACYVDFDHEVYYAQTITGKLSYGSITNLSGIQAKEAFFWVPVSAIRTDIPRSDYIYFNVGPISKKLPISQFETIPTCKVKSMPL